MKRNRFIIYSKDHAKILRVAWTKGNMVTSEDVSSILYYEGKPIPKGERARAIRNAVMTLRRMKDEGLIINVVKDEKKRLRKYIVISKKELQGRILRELNELFGEDFISIA